MRTLAGMPILALFLVACAPEEGIVPLPAAARAGATSVEEALAARRSVRTFSPKALAQKEIAQLLWAAQGTSYRADRRTAPSAGALYPLEVYVATAQGLFHYEPKPHRLRVAGRRDLRGAIAKAALGQEAIRGAPAVFVIAGVEARTARKYGARATRYVHMEAGHAAQNLMLQAAAWGLGGVTIGAFEDDALARVLALPRGTLPLYVIPMGHPR